MKKLIWCDADVYGQLAVWIFSLLPFIFFLPSALRKNDFFMLLMIHGLGLLIIGLWQFTSTIINFLLTEKERKTYFRNNALLGLLLGGLFFLWAFYSDFDLQLPAGKDYYKYVLAMYFVLIDVIIIRYWRYLISYYKALNHA